MVYDAIAIILLVLFTVLWITGTVVMGFVMYYLFKTTGGFRADRKWGRFFPYALFLPWFFTDEGNTYRVKFFRAMGLFLALIAAAFAVGFAMEHLDTLLPQMPMEVEG